MRSLLNSQQALPTRDIHTPPPIPSTPNGHTKSLLLTRIIPLQKLARIVNSLIRISLIRIINLPILLLELKIEQHSRKFELRCCVEGENCVGFGGVGIVVDEEVRVAGVGGGGDEEAGLEDLDLF